MADVLNAKMEELIQASGGRGNATITPPTTSDLPTEYEDLTEAQKAELLKARAYSPGPTVEASAPQKKPEPIRPWTATEIETLKAIEEIDPRESQRLRGPGREGAPKGALADYAALKAYDDRFGTDYLRQHITGEAYGLPPE